jgi:hypothetical protein
VLTCLLYRLLCGLVRLLARGGGERELEIVVLRHQLAILRRGGKRPQYTIADRAFLAAASRLLPPARWSCFAVGPQTLCRWHRALLEGGRRRRPCRPGRPPLAPETRCLIKRLARENPRWGYMRIQGELLKLGIGVSATTIATVLRSSGLGPAPRRIGPSWSEFLCAQTHSMLDGGLRPAVGGGLEGDASASNWTAQGGEAREVEADDNRSPAAADEPRLASRPLSVPEPQCAATAAHSPCDGRTVPLRPSHRSHARDGPPRAGRHVSPRSTVLARRSKPIAAPASGQPHVESSRKVPSIRQPRGVGATEQPPPARWRPEPSFLYPTSYVDYVVPAIFIEAVLIGGMTTSIGLAQDLKSGIIDRFRSLPMARSAVLAGRTLADLSRSLFSLAIMVGLSRDRPDRRHPPLLHPHVRQQRRRPGRHHARLAATLRPQPTPQRYRLRGPRPPRRRPATRWLWQSLAWCAGILIVFFAAALRLYRNTTG